MFASLRARYYIVVIGVATIPVLLLGLYTGTRSAIELERQSLILQTELATRVEREIATFISARINELNVLEQTNVLSDMDDRELEASLRRLLAHDQVFQELAVLDVDGKIRTFASRTDISSENGNRWSEAAFSQSGYWTEIDAYVGQIIYDEELREPLLDIALPIVKRRTGDVANILLASVRFRSIWDLLADLELPVETDAFLVDASGRILAHRSPAEVLSGRVYDGPLANGRYPLLDGGDGLVAIRSLSLVGLPAYVIITRPLSSALSSANEIRSTTLIAGLILLIAASVLALIQTTAIVRPVEQLARAARRISDGDLDARIEVAGPREINALSNTFQEMTDRLRGTIRDLERSEFAERQRAMVTLESIGDAVIATDANSIVTYLNPVAEALTGWSLEEARGQMISQVFCIINENTREPAPNPVARCLESGKIVGLANHTALISRDGQEYSISDSAAPIREEGGEVIGVVMVFSDGTERKAMEQSLRQSQKLEAIGKLSGGIAHDFNNLMQVIQGNAELLAEDPGLDAGLTTPILRATERGAELTKRLLAFSRQHPLQSRSVDVTELLADFLPMLDRTLGESIDVSLQKDGGIWTAKVDPGQLETALLNLALNARDAMPDGGKLQVRCANATRKEFRTEPEGDLNETEFVAISVSDDGTGMTAATLKQAIDPFFTTKGVGEGSGLGLSMVYGFVMQSGGHFEIDSAEDAGTKITMFLPRSRELVSETRANAVVAPISGRGEKVLVVEDDVEVRALARRVIEDLGYRVVDVETVADARKALTNLGDIDLVLSDIVLTGGVSGLEFARELIDTRPDLPVALMSGYPEAMAADQDLAEWGFVLLNKPFQRAELASTLRRLLDKQAGV